VRGVQRFFGVVTLSRAHFVFATDPVFVEFVRQDYGKKAMFLPNGYDADLFQIPGDYRKTPSGLKIIVFVGKIDVSIYRLDVLLDALKLVTDRFPEVRLRVIGNGPDRVRLKSLASHLAIEKFVDFAGPVPHEAVPPQLAASSICVHITNDM
jgi:glycosyltransferase involved in cell wall biosynthesis